MGLSGLDGAEETGWGDQLGNPPAFFRAQPGSRSRWLDLRATGCGELGGGAYLWIEALSLGQDEQKGLNQPTQIALQFDRHAGTVRQQLLKFDWSEHQGITTQRQVLQWPRQQALVLGPSC